MSFFSMFRDIIDNIFHLNEYSDLGKAGEQNAYKVLTRLFPQKHILRNVYLKNKYGNYCEIDMIALSEKGFFVVESKNYTGRIFGKESDERWTQKFERSTYTFYNPIRQNNTHINTLKYIFNNPPIHAFHSIILFGDGCKIMKMETSSKNVYICQLNQLSHLINMINNNTNDIYTSNIIESYCNYLKDFSRPDKNISDTHKRQHNY